MNDYARQWLASKVAEAERTGILWLGGEMEIPINQGPNAAYRAAARIAEACGYMAGFKYGHTAINVTGGDIPGECVIDWFNPENLTAVKVSLWTEEAVYLKSAAEALAIA